MSDEIEENKEKGWEVPWIHGPDWQQMLLVVSRSCSTIERRDEARQSAGRISELYGELEEPLNLLCSSTCPSCKEVCCKRATVWYDQRDLLFYYLQFDSFPERQITKRSNGFCCHLGPMGCKLSRPERPFICTWYLCQPQGNIINAGADHALLRVRELIGEIKEERKKLSSLCFMK